MRQMTHDARGANSPSPLIKLVSNPCPPIPHSKKKLKSPGLFFGGKVDARAYIIEDPYPEILRTNTNSTHHGNIYTNRRREHHMYWRQNDLVRTIKDPSGRYLFSSTTATNCTRRINNLLQRRYKRMPTTSTTRSRRHQRIPSTWQRWQLHSVEVSNRPQKKTNAFSTHWNQQR